MATFDLEHQTTTNTNYRHVLYTATGGNGIQLVVMSLPPKGSIDKEIHTNADQFFRVEKGELRVVIYFPDKPSETIIVPENNAIVIPRGTEHEIFNNSSENEVKLYTIYTTAQHKPATIQQFKPVNEHDHDHNPDIALASQAIPSFNPNQLKQYNYYTKYLKYIQKYIHTLKQS
jgi:mannose-6-phosphate isomerase-like protein (cupin superfamily)